MNSVPLQAIPSQIVTISLGSQSVRLKVYQKQFGVFVDIFVNDVPILYGALALAGNRIVRNAYLEFSGDLAFFDTFASYNGSPGSPIITDPVFTGLGGRYQLVYFSPADLANLGIVE